LIQVPADVAGQMSEAENRGSFFYPRVPFIVSAYGEDTPNKDVFQIKDRIIEVDGQPLPYYDMASERLAAYAGKTVNMTVDREGARVRVQAQVNEDGKIGIMTHILKMEEMAKMGLYDFDTREYGFIESFPAGWAKTMDKLGGYVRQFSLIFDPSTGAHKGLGGFISIGKLFPAEWDWQVFWSITALLSIILAVMNLLPIPVLDGGHVVFLLWEMATGRQPNQKILEYAQLVGFILLIALLLYANGLDVIREFFQ
jgi:regulator of sigma E protease